MEELSKLLVPILSALGAVGTTLIAAYTTLWKRLVALHDKRIEDKDKVIASMAETIKQKDEIIDRQQAKIDEIYQVAIMRYRNQL